VISSWSVTEQQVADNGDDKDDYDDSSCDSDTDVEQRRTEHRLVLGLVIAGWSLYYSVLSCVFYTVCVDETDTRRVICELFQVLVRETVYTQSVP